MEGGHISPVSVWLAPVKQATTGWNDKFTSKPLATQVHFEAAMKHSVVSTFNQSSNICKDPVSLKTSCLSLTVSFFTVVSLLLQFINVAAVVLNMPKWCDYFKVLLILQYFNGMYLWDVYHLICRERAPVHPLGSEEDVLLPSSEKLLL